MLEEITKEVTAALLRQRPEKINKTQYGIYSTRELELLYSDSKKEYEETAIYEQDRLLGSAKALAAYIKEELRRRENPTGDKATVRISMTGGQFIADEDFREGIASYNRINSQQWNVVKKFLNQPLNHSQFLEFFQALKPSIDNFHDLYQSFSAIRIVGKSELVSNPIFIRGEQKSGIKCTYALEDGREGEEILPENFSVKVPFVKAGETLYDIPLDLIYARDERDCLSIRVICPTFENIEEQAIIDEAKFIKNETKEFEKLLVLSDF